MAYIRFRKTGRVHFCDFPREDNDEERLILHREKKLLRYLQRIPYNPGHLWSLHTAIQLIMRRCATGNAGTPQAWRTCIEVLKKVIDPPGISTLASIRKVAGGGFDASSFSRCSQVERVDTNSARLADCGSSRKAFGKTYKNEDAWPLWTTGYCQPLQWNSSREVKIEKSRFIASIRSAVPKKKPGKTEAVSENIGRLP